MATTIKKIAELAGVSTGTVDRALHDRGRVSPKVAQRIKKIAEELNYRPNSVAKSLSTRNKKIKIAVILHVEKRNRYFDDVIAGIKKCQEEIKDFGITIDIMTCPNFDAEEQLKQINLSLENGSSAIVIVPISHPVIKERLNELYRTGYPIVFLTNIIEDTDYLSFVGCNYELMGQLTAGLLNLLNCGEGKLLLFSPSLQMYGHRLRADGLQNQLLKEYPKIQLQEIYEMTGNDIQDYQITKEALAKFPNTNLFVCPGAYSRGNLQAIQECGYFWKSKILCYDYSDEIRSEIQNRSISAIITQCPQEQGYMAVKLLFDYFVIDKKPRIKNYYIRGRVIVSENLSEIEQIRMEYGQIHDAAAKNK